MRSNETTEHSILWFQETLLIQYAQNRFASGSPFGGAVCEADGEGGPSSEHLLPGGFADCAVGSEAVAALVALHGGCGGSTVFAVGGELFTQRVQLLLHQPDRAAGTALPQHDAGVGDVQAVFGGVLV